MGVGGSFLLNVSIIVKMVSNSFCVFKNIIHLFILLSIVPGSGRVTFSSHKSYMKAVNAAFVEVKTPKFAKKVGYL